MLFFGFLLIFQKSIYSSNEDWEVKKKIILNSQLDLIGNKSQFQKSNKSDTDYDTKSLADAIITLQSTKSLPSLNIKFGGNLRLNATKQRAKYGNIYSSDQSFIFLQTQKSKIEVGNLPGVTQKLQTNGGTVFASNLGINGDTAYWIRKILPSQYATQTSINSGSWSTQFGHQLNRLNTLKVNYIFKYNDALQIGLSYSPRSQGRTLMHTEYNFDSSYDNFADRKYNDVVGFAAVYADQYKGINFKFGANAEFARPHRSKQELMIHEDSGQKYALHGENSNSLKSMEFGFNLGYFGFVIGGAYGFSGKSGLFDTYKYVKKSDDSVADIAQKNEYKNQKHRSMGISYSIKSVTLGITQNQSYNNVIQINNDNKIISERMKFTNNVFSLQYQMNKRLIYYAEFAKFKLNPAVKNSKLEKNSGNILLVGLKFII